MATNDDRLRIEADLVRRLVVAQFPAWAHLPVRRVPVDGWDNSTFRLGDTMKVRLPTAGCYAAQVAKEQRWLPYLAPHLPLPIPVPLAVGAPAEGYPWPWAIHGWLEGEPASSQNVADQRRFALDVARFLLALQRVDAAGGPPAGPANFHRGGRLGVYDAETRRCVAALRGEIDSDAALATWEDALAASWSGPPVWVHGDIAPGNLLVAGGRLCAVIDFGSCAIGDPACDLVLAWTLLSGEARRLFRATLAVDEATWARARGWALWKALLMLAGDSTASAAATSQRHVIASVLADRDQA